MTNSAGLNSGVLGLLKANDVSHYWNIFFTILDEWIAALSIKITMLFLSVKISWKYIFLKKLPKYEVKEYLSYAFLII